MAIIKTHELTVPTEGSKLNVLVVCNSRCEKSKALAGIEMVAGKPHISVLEASDGDADNVFVMVVRRNVDFNNSPSLGLMSTTTFDADLGFFKQEGVVYHVFGHGL